jgi:hypothetical protein
MPHVFLPLVMAHTRRLDEAFHLKAKLQFYNDNQPCHFWGHPRAEDGGGTYNPLKPAARVFLPASPNESEYFPPKHGHNLTLKLTEIEIHKTESSEDRIPLRFFVYSSVKLNSLARRRRASRLDIDQHQQSVA